MIVLVQPQIMLLMVLGDGLLFLFSFQEGFFWRVETPGQIHQVKWSPQQGPSFASKWPRITELTGIWVCKSLVQKNKTCLGLSYLRFWWFIAAKKRTAKRLPTWKSFIKGWYVKLPVDVHQQIVRQIANMCIRGDSFSDDHQSRRLISWYSKYM